MTAKTSDMAPPQLADMPRLPDGAGAQVLVDSAPELSGPSVATESDQSVFDPSTPSPPTVPDLTLPTLPDAPAVVVPSIPANAAPNSASVDRQVDLAPTRKSKAGYGELPTSDGPSEATLAARAKREAAKKRAKRNKFIAVVIVIAVAALAGPPLVGWVQEGLNDAGSTETDERPVEETPANDAPAGDSPVGDLIDDANEVVGGGATVDDQPESPTAPDDAETGSNTDTDG